MPFLPANSGPPDEGAPAPFGRRVLVVLLVQVVTLVALYLFGRHFS